MVDKRQTQIILSFMYVVVMNTWYSSSSCSRESAEHWVHTADLQLIVLVVCWPRTVQGEVVGVLR